MYKPITIFGDIEMKLELNLEIEFNLEFLIQKSRTKSQEFVFTGLLVNVRRFL